MNDDVKWYPKMPNLAIISHLRAAARKFEDIAKMDVFEDYLGHMSKFTSRGS